MTTWNQRKNRCRLPAPGALATLLLLGAALPAQHDPSPTPAEQKRGSKTPPTHHPHPTLPPALVLRHLRRRNAAVADALHARRPAPAHEPRPSGAGRYLCAVFVCADCDVDAPAALGLERRDVLVLRSPGPLVERPAIALLEHLVDDERLPLVLFLTHENCLSLRIGTEKKRTTPQQNALASRLARAKQTAAATRLPFPAAHARLQRELLLASSTPLRRACDEDRLRVVGAEIDERSLRITWHVRPADELPVPIVK